MSLWLIKVLAISLCNENFSSVKRFTDCAIVFDAGYMYNKQTGKYIDTHSYVWRINVRKPLNTRSLGNKTDIMVTSFANENPSIRLIKENHKWNSLKSLFSFETDFNKYNMYLSMCNKTKIDWYFVPITYMKTCKYIVGKKCSTCMMSVILAQELCDTVNLFGGGNNEGYPYSLLDVENRKRRIKDHNIEKEHEKYKNWNNFKLLV